MNVKIISPVGSMASLHAAIQAKADAIYFGIGSLHMRQVATPFTKRDLYKIIKTCKDNNILSFVTLNTIIYNKDLYSLQKTLEELKKAGVDAIIASDFAVLEEAKKLGLSIHGSTQLNISNISSLKFFANYLDTVILARELDEKEIQAICKTIEKENILGPSKKLLKVEIFAHGALCMAISGKCYLSEHLYKSSANRGKCLQVCRRAYRLIEEETSKEISLENRYLLSPKDLCTLPYLNKIVKWGVSYLKIEGRARGADYVKKVTQSYREALEAIKNKTFTKENIDIWMKELSSVYNRGFWVGGYYFNEKDFISKTPHSQATEEKSYVGLVVNYFSKAKALSIKVEDHPLKLSDKILIIGPTTGALEYQIETLLHTNEEGVAKKGEIVSIPFFQKARRGDRIYILKKRVSK